MKFEDLKFRLDNTEGFTQAKLDIMNKELEIAIENNGLNIEDERDAGIAKALGDQIFKKYC